MAGVVVLVLVAAAVATAVLRRDGEPPPRPDPSIAKAVTAIAESFTEGDGGIYFQPGYGRCVGTQTVEATGVQALVDDDYLDASLTEAVGPTDVDSMSEGVATAWADAQVECEDWDATSRYLDGPDYAYSAADVTQYTDCMREIGDDKQRTALRKEATGDSDGNTVSYRLDILGCTAKLL